MKVTDSMARRGEEERETDEMRTDGGREENMKEVAVGEWSVSSRIER